MNRQVLLATGSVLVALAGTLVVLELICRFLPVSEGHGGVAPVFADTPIARYLPNRDMVFSTGWNFSIRAAKHVNNTGFLTDRDFSIDHDERPVAMIGASYVEAVHVANSASVGGRLDGWIPAPVYALGFSGRHLPGYLDYARFAERFGADRLVFVIAGHNFYESLCAYGSGGHAISCFQEQPDGRMDWVSPDQTHETFLLRDIARRSALLRYLVFNCGLDWRRIVARVRGRNTVYVGNVAARVSPERYRASQVAVDRFFELLPTVTSVPPERILFAIDGIRHEIYAGTTDADAYFSRMRAYLMTQARANGYEVLDLHPVFAQDYAAHGDKFEYAIDGHWNERGHCVAARAIAASETISGTTEAERPMADCPPGQRY